MPSVISAHLRTILFYYANLNAVVSVVSNLECVFFRMALLRGFNSIALLDISAMQFI